MSAPEEGYGQYPSPGQQYAEQPEYPEQGQGYDGAGSPPGTAGGHQPTEQHGKKKKRAYAAQAFEVGQGGNVAAGGQMPPVGQFGIPQPVVPGYGGYPAQDPQAPAYGATPQPAYGVPQPGNPVGGAAGYQAPEPYYPGGTPAPAPGVAGITQGMAGMQMGAQPGQAVPGAAARPVALNQLYPTDLINQPFNVSELALPPPPIILPPNVGLTSLRAMICDGQC